MPKITENIAVNATGGAVVSLSSTIWARKITIEEDPNNGAGVGLAYQLPEENFLITHKLEIGGKYTLGNTVAQGKGAGPIIGRPAQNDSGSLTGTQVATVYAKIVSQGVATKARTVETE